VYALEVSKEITQRIDGPENFELHLFDGLVIPHFPEKANVIYSNQVMEHLHPEDVLEQLSAIYHTLDEKGIYICVTPNRLTGLMIFHDILILSRRAFISRNTRTPTWPRFFQKLAFHEYRPMQAQRDFMYAFLFYSSKTQKSAGSLFSPLQRSPGRYKIEQTWWCQGRLSTFWTIRSIWYNFSYQ